MRGIIMDIKDGKAIVLRNNGDVAEIKDKGYKIGQTIITYHNSYKKILISAACFVFAAVGCISGYAAAYRTPADYIYMDINPSVRLDMNCFDKVISVVPLNDDASGLLGDNKSHPKDAESCIDEIIKSCREKNYLNGQNNNVEFSIITGSSKSDGHIRSVSERLEKEDCTVIINNIDSDENNAALKYRTSPKRLKAVKSYTDSFGGTLEDNFSALKGVTNKEIYNMIKSSNNSRDTEDEQNDKPTTAERKYKASPERLDAIKKYTETFGGTLEENTKALKGIDTKEISDATESKTPIDVLDK